MTRVAVIDAKFGTTKNLLGMLDYMGYSASLVSSPEDLRKFSHCVLPGVGSFSSGAENLVKSGFMEAIKDFSDQGNAVLGVCLGMQLLGLESDEGEGSGLGLLNFSVKPIGGNSRISSHMGWNIVSWGDPEIERLFNGRSSFYFNHSYAAHAQSANVLGVSTFVRQFASVVLNGRVLGAQFHPEKSHVNGMKFLEYFLEYV
jgi:glutamine amidotransferase